jgi:hypothetical protein
MLPDLVIGSGARRSWSWRKRVHGLTQKSLKQNRFINARQSESTLLRGDEGRLQNEWLLRRSLRGSEDTEVIIPRSWVICHWLLETGLCIINPSHTLDWGVWGLGWSHHSFSFSVGCGACRLTRACLMLSHFIISGPGCDFLKSTLKPLFSVSGFLTLSIPYANDELFPICTVQYGGH